VTYVYVVGPDDPDMKLPTPAIKIGKAKDPLSRLRGIQTGSPIKLTFYALWKFASQPQANTVESACHRKFRERRLSGEWFQVKCSEVYTFVHGDLWTRYSPEIKLYGPHH
jgi:Meiotically up-regulated gene 113